MKKFIISSFVIILMFSNVFLYSENIKSEIASSTMTVKLENSEAIRSSTSYSLQTTNLQVSKLKLSTTTSISSIPVRIVTTVKCCECCNSDNCLKTCYEKGFCKKCCINKKCLKCLESSECSKSLKSKNISKNEKKIKYCNKG